MPRYMSLVKYTAEALEGVRKDGYATRPPAVTAAAASLGCTVESVDFTFPGEWDFMIVMSAPSAKEALAMSSFSMGSGVVERTEMHELFSPEEMDQAISGTDPDYTAPGQ